MKTCIKCTHTKPLIEFSKRSRNKDGLENVCKECKNTYEQAYYRYAPNQMKTKRKAISKIRKLATLRIINTFLLSKWCIDCRYNANPAALQFDHIKDKNHNISDMVKNWYGIEAIFEEIKKCEVRCANCHHIKTARDFRWYQ